MNKQSINYGNIIKKLRKEHKMTQTQLGEKLSIGKTSIANYETGYSVPSAPVLEKIASIFEMTLVQLLMYDDPKQDNTMNLSDPKGAQPVNNMVIRYIRPSDISIEVLDAENYMSAYVSVPADMFEDSHASYFYTKMTDDSMENDGIRKNDYVFIRKDDTPENNSVVFAIDTSTNKYYIRKYMRENHIITLIPSSYSVDYVIIREDLRETNLKIIGYVEKTLNKIYNS